MKIGLDVHGVIDDNPVFWSAITESLIKEGHEVHIITGHPLNSKLTDKLSRMNIKCSCLFSIVDYHKSIGTKMWQDQNGHWFMNPEIWDRTKADYCAREGIDLHIDDSKVYGEFFTTPYSLYLGTINPPTNIEEIGVDV